MFSRAKDFDVFKLLTGEAIPRKNLIGGGGGKSNSKRSTVLLKRSRSLSIRLGARRWSTRPRGLEFGPVPKKKVKTHESIRGSAGSHGPGGALKDSTCKQS